MVKFFKGMSFFNQILRMIIYIGDIRGTHPAGTALSATSWRQTGIHSRMYSSNLSWPRWIGYLTYTGILYQFMIWFKNLSRPAINSFLIANAGRAVCCFVAVEVGACAGSVTPHGGPEPQARRLSKKNSLLKLIPQNNQQIKDNTRPKVLSLLILQNNRQIENNTRPRVLSLLQTSYYFFKVPKNKLQIKKSTIPESKRQIKNVAVFNNANLHPSNSTISQNKPQTKDVIIFSNVILFFQNKLKRYTQLGMTSPKMPKKVMVS